MTVCSGHCQGYRQTYPSYYFRATLVISLSAGIELWKTLAYLYALTDCVIVLGDLCVVLPLPTGSGAASVHCIVIAEHMPYYWICF